MGEVTVEAGWVTVVSDYKEGEDTRRKSPEDKERL